MNPQTLATVLLLAFVSGSECIREKRSDGVRCRLTNGFLCRWSCRAFGHSDGECDQEDVCRCSEETLEHYVCGGGEDGSFPPAADGLSDADTADALCAGYCQIKGKQTGQCDVSVGECVCVSAALSAGHAACASDSICAMYCQWSERAATGRCQGEHGWECVCQSHNDVEGSKE